MMDINYLEDPLADPEETRILKAAVDDDPTKIGWLYQGYGSGLHLEICYMKTTKQLKVHYKGYQVYHEWFGELQGYAPFPDWEKLIERLYKQAKKRKEEMQELMRPQVEVEEQRKRLNFLQRLRLRWGI